MFLFHLRKRSFVTAARLFALEAPLPGAKPELKRLAALLVRDHRPGDWAQALMDLGATVCRPRAPLCGRCPVAFACEGLKTGAPERYPLKAPKAARPRRRGAVFVLRDGQGRVALERRPDKGLLGGMLGLPTSAWDETGAGVEAAPVRADWRARGEVEHVFTHFSLTLTVFEAAGSGDFVWMETEEAAQALPSVFRKALRL